MILKILFFTGFKFFHDSISRRWIHERKLLVVEAMGICFWVADSDSVYAYNDAHGRSRVRIGNADRERQPGKHWGGGGEWNRLYGQLRL
jgi:hypothetical protein